MTETKREGLDRRRVHRGGRRESDLGTLTPEVRTEAGEYAAGIHQCLEVLSASLEDSDLVGAREASKRIKRAADALKLLLATGKSMKKE
jgi:hypothetical protein